jgi:predicted component of type VI protein secretion system
MDSVYFTLNTSGDAWDMVKGSKTVAIYVPVELSGVSFELFAVTQTE